MGEAAGAARGSIGATFPAGAPWPTRDSSRPSALRGSATRRMVRRHARAAASAAPAGRSTRAASPAARQRRTRVRCHQPGAWTELRVAWRSKLKVSSGGSPRSSAMRPPAPLSEAMPHQDRAAQVIRYGASPRPGSRPATRRRRSLPASISQPQGAPASACGSGCAPTGSSPAGVRPGGRSGSRLQPPGAARRGAARMQHQASSRRAPAG